ncbi:MAG: PAS domain S-box protein [Gemmataceae bacterium]
MDLLGNVTVLERPTRVAALVSAVRTALRARQKQYQIRDHLADRDRAAETQSLLAAIVASSDDAIISKTIEGIILSWNAGAERLFGYSAAEAIGRSITMLIPAERQGEEPKILERLRRGESIEHYETVRVSKDGRLLDISLTVSPIRDAKGTIIGASKVARDITHRKRAEAELKVLSLLPKQNPSPVIRIARDGTLLYANPGAHRVLSEWNLQVGKPVPERLRELMVPPSDGLLVFDRERSVVGREFLITVAFVPEADYANLYWTDITERKRVEEALRDADRRKDEFLAMLAHELRNPLAPIRNSLHILRMGSPQESATDCVTEMMERQVNHMVHLVDDLLEVSRISRGKIELRLEPVEVAGVVRTAVETSRPLIDAGGHQLALAIPAEPLTLKGDFVRLTQIVANLLNNAAKYSDAGGQIWLSVRREKDGVAISVKDTGQGIPPDMIPRIFDLFMQVDRGPHRTRDGLGIGLTLVKSLVEMHGGSVVAHSEGLGRGSEFVVRLPLWKEGGGSAKDKKRASNSVSSFVLHPSPLRKVLVVDDNRDAAESLGVLLKLLGADVKVVFSGPDALEALATYKPAVVLLDIGMPGMDGHEVARRIRQQPDAKDVTLIALTGWGQEEDRLRSESAGFDYHLIKPADVNALQTLLVSLEDRPGGRRTGR